MVHRRNGPHPPDIAADLHDVFETSIRCRYCRRSRRRADAERRQEPIARLAAAFAERLPNAGLELIRGYGMA